MNFHLQFPTIPCVEKLNYSQSSFFMGSCFAENIGDTMQQFKFKTIVNPHGILYNPLSIAVALRRYMKSDFVTESELFFANDCWNSWEHHSRFSNPDQQNCLLEINKNISDAHVSLKNAEWLFITFGSAFVYRKNNKLVSNCHKQPQKEFLKQLLNPSEIIDAYTSLMMELKKFNPKLKIVFTISPVRYVRDGVVENNLSKARLIDAVHQLKNDAAFYFPAYELVIDDLRDYRFYKEDMVHPNEQAVKYVFDKFRNSFFDESTDSLFERINEILLAKKHKPFNADSTSHKKFKNNFLQRIQSIQTQHPFLDLRAEQTYFS